MPKGKTHRMQQYTRGLAFTVTKEVLQSPCTSTTAYSNQYTIGPVSSNAESSHLYKLVS